MVSARSPSFHNVLTCKQLGKRYANSCYAVANALPESISATAQQRLDVKIPDDWLRWEHVETPMPDEERKINELCEVVRYTVQRNFDAHGHGFRGTHVRMPDLLNGGIVIIISILLDQDARDRQRRAQSA